MVAPTPSPPNPAVSSPTSDTSPQKWVKEELEREGQPYGKLEGRAQCILTAPVVWVVLQGNIEPTFSLRASGSPSAQTGRALQCRCQQGRPSSQAVPGCSLTSGSSHFPCAAPLPLSPAPGDLEAFPCPSD